jgi:hypothetical protein
MRWLLRPPDPAWRLFRAVLIGSVMGWVVGSLTLFGLLWSGNLPAEDRAWVYQLIGTMTGLFGFAVLANHPRVFAARVLVWGAVLRLARRVP